MKKLNKIVFGIAIIFLGILLITFILRTLFGLEFANDSIKEDYQGFLLFAIPIGILFTLFGTLKSKDRRILKLIKILITSMIAGFSFFILFISITFDMCGWTDKQILYQNINNQKTKIIVREFGCGATDSGRPNIHIQKVQNFTEYFIRKTEIDTANIDKKEWIKIE